MAKNKIRDDVLNDYNHKCAICGEIRPHLHHIDTDTENNDPLNLIPLCPNCHLTDQHNPTQGRDPRILILFRKYKDPFILKSQFMPLLSRFQFIYNDYKSSDISAIIDMADELVTFIKCLEMGAFYSKQIDILTSEKTSAFRPMKSDQVRDEQRKMDEHNLPFRPTKSDQEHKEEREEEKCRYINKIKHNRDKIESLLIELSRYQNWKTVFDSRILMTKVF